MFKVSFNIIVFGLLLVFSSNLWATGNQYDIRVDGLACPYCAYGLEKQFLKVDGVVSFDINLEKGIVTVKTTVNTDFSDQQLRKIVNDAGFTFKSYTQKGD